MAEETFMEELAKYSEAFDKLCQERHEKGQVEYGVFTFLENDVVKMMAEELADTSNYCRMQFMKLMILQHMLEDKLAGIYGADPEGGDYSMGMGSFKGTGDVGWIK